MMTLHVVVQELPIKNLSSHVYFFPYHPQTLQMASIVIFLETPDWTWYHDPTLDSIYLVGHASVRMYIFFSRPFVVTVLSPQFDQEFPFNGVPLYAAHPSYPSPSPPPSPSIKSNPSQDSSSSLSSGEDQEVPEL